MRVPVLRRLVLLGLAALAALGLLAGPASAAPPNDDRARATPLTADGPVDATNVDATEETGESLVCAGVPYARTVWFRWTAPEVGDAELNADGNFGNTNQPRDTVMAVYRERDGVQVGCNDDAGWFFSSSRVSLRVEPTTYLIQVGARDHGGLVGEGVISAWVTFRPDRDLDRDGWLRPQDCDDGNAGVHPGAPDRPGDGADQDCDARDADDDGYAVPSDCDDRSPGVNPGAVDVPDDGVDQDCDRADAVDTDRDDDGFSRPQDCRDDRRDVNPGAVDVPGDRVDQDCAEGDAPYPALLSGVSGYFRRAGRSLAFVELAVSSVPRRTSVVLRCRGRGCPFERRTRSVERAASRVDLTRTVRSVRLRRGTVFELTLLKRGHVGRVVRWSVRSLRRAPRRTNLCRPPGTRRPGSCEEPARGAAARAP